MQIKSYPCFGWVIDRTTLRRGEFINDRVMAANNFTVEGNKLVRDDGELKRYWWFLESGHNQHENIDTGVVADQLPGWSNVDSPMPNGDFLLKVLEPCAVWCFNETANESLPDFDFQKVAAGDSWGFQDGARVFLMSGGFEFNGKLVTGPRPFIVSGNKYGVATADSMFIVLRD